MSENEEPEVTETEEEPEHEEHPGLTLDGLADKVDDLADKLTAFLKGGGGRRPTQQDEAEQVAAQVRSELGKIKTAEKRDDRVGRLEEQLKAMTEKPPKEYRRITKILWGEDD